MKHLVKAEDIICIENDPQQLANTAEVNDIVNEVENIIPLENRKETTGLLAIGSHYSPSVIKSQLENSENIRKNDIDSMRKDANEKSIAQLKSMLMTNAEAEVVPGLVLDSTFTKELNANLEKKPNLLSKIKRLFK